MNNALNLLPIRNAQISYAERIAFPRSPEELLHELIDQIKWKQSDVVIKGKAFKQPRLTAWYGDEGAEYTYSGLNNTPSPWTPLLEEIKTVVEAAAGCTFNSALLNYYRHNRDSIGFHSDDEPGLDSTIASVSFGHERTFILKPKWNRPGETHELRLASGSLLIMAGATQRNWVHGIEKETTPCGPRVNLTFRRIVAP
jgi:alkylated DNA repair dioxygenase AlkB